MAPLYLCPPVLWNILASYLSRLHHLPKLVSACRWEKTQCPDLYLTMKTARTLSSQSVNCYTIAKNAQVSRLFPVSPFPCFIATRSLFCHSGTPSVTMPLMSKFLFKFMTLITRMLNSAHKLKAYTLIYH